MLGLLVAVKQHGLGLGTAYVGDLGNLLESIGEGGNFVFARFYAVCPKFCYCVLVEIGCWCRQAFAPIFRHFIQTETLPAQKPEMLSPRIACSLVCVRFQESQRDSSPSDRSLEHRVAIFWQSTLMVWVDLDCKVTIATTSFPLPLRSADVSLGMLNRYQENKDFFFLFYAGNN